MAVEAAGGSRRYAYLYDVPVYDPAHRSLPLHQRQLTPSLSRPVNDAQLNLTASTASRAKLVTSEVQPATARDNELSVSLGRECLTIP